LSVHLRSILFFLTAALPPCTGCVLYDASSADAVAIADEVRERPGGAWTVDEAVRLALERSPVLRAAEAEARAAGAERTVPQTWVGEYRGRNDSTGLMIDPVALLGLGPRGGEIDVAKARHAEALADLAVARWQTIAAVTESFLVDASLADAELAAEAVEPDFDIDLGAFERAGLASSLAAAQARTARALAESERLEIERTRQEARARVRTLLGLDAGAELELVAIPDDWLQQPRGKPGELLERPDLRLATARFERADAAFRKAVADQYPSLLVGPNLSLRGDPLAAMAMLNIPIGMQGRARAARERRQAERDRLEAAFLRAQEEATVADRDLEASHARVAATSLALETSRTAFRSARVAIDFEPNAFDAFGRTALGLQQALASHRQAVVAHARAQVARARAWGWPIAGTLAEGQEAGGQEAEGREAHARPVDGGTHAVAASAHATTTDPAANPAAHAREASADRRHDAARNAPRDATHHPAPDASAEIRRADAGRTTEHAEEPR
jgi:outer membrane protein TolC